MELWTVVDKIHIDDLKLNMRLLGGYVVSINVPVVLQQPT